MQIKRFSIVLGVAAALAAAVAATAIAAPARVGQAPAIESPSGIVLAQSVKERALDEVPPVDAGRAPPARTAPPAYSPPASASPPPPPPVPTAPRVTTRIAPPPAADDDSSPPAREVPPPPTSTSRMTPPPQFREPATVQRAAPRYEEPPPARRADAPQRARSTRSAFEANCTQQCHLSCEASFEACNGDSSPAKPACVKKLESCRVERCSCRFD